jgi:hypothetical protein
MPFMNKGQCLLEVWSTESSCPKVRCGQIWRQYTNNLKSYDQGTSLRTATATPKWM